MENPKDKKDASKSPKAPSGSDSAPDPGLHEEMTQVLNEDGTAKEIEEPVPHTAQETPLDALKKELLYLRADFDNYRKRMVREQEQAIRFANEKLVGELSGIVDLFDRALLASQPLKAKPSEDVSNFITGIEMTHREFTHLLGRFGVEFIGATGEKFDPAKHEAVAQAEAPTEKADLVLEVMQKGCLFHGRLLKPARVVVAKKKD